MWKSPFLKCLFIALLSLPFVLSVFLPRSIPDIPLLTQVGAPLPKPPSAIPPSGGDYAWLSDTELVYCDFRQPGVHPVVWNWRAGQITTQTGYTPPAKPRWTFWGILPSPDGRYLIFTGREFLSNKSANFREWVHVMDLWAAPGKSGFLQSISHQRVLNARWFPDSKRYFLSPFLWSMSGIRSQKDILVKNISQPGKLTPLPANKAHFHKEGRQIVGITQEGDAIHFCCNFERNVGTGHLVHTPLDNPARPMREYMVRQPRSQATTGFYPVSLSVSQSKNNQHSILWIEKRTIDPLHRMGNQINQVVAKLRLWQLLRLQVDHYSVLWVSNADGTDFRPIGRTPPGMEVANLQWLPQSHQIAVLLRKYSRNKPTENRFFFCPVQ